MKDKDNRTLTIIRTAKAHINRGNLGFAVQVLEGHIATLELEAKDERIRDKEQHGDVRHGHPHQHVDISEVHYHRAGRTETKMLPMVIPGDVYAMQDLLEGLLN